MSILRHLNLNLNHHIQQSKHFFRRFATVAAEAATRPETSIWTQAPISNIIPAAESLFHVTIDVSDSPEVLNSYTIPGQYLQVRLRDVVRPTFLAIASPPCFVAERGEFQFLVKSVAGSMAEVLCRKEKGDMVELSQAIGRGFSIDQISPPEKYQTVLIFATGSGISPIRSLIESGFGADKRSDVRLYYGARNLQRMAYQDRFKAWESSGVKIVPVLSRPNYSWTGESGYVQAAFARAKKLFSPSSTGAVLCGQKLMAEEITSILLADGVSNDRILKNV